MLLSPAQGIEEAAAIEAGGVPAGLCYSSDTEPGITRLRKGDGFVYRDSQGRPVRGQAQLARIRKLAIPPAYTSVWICASPDGHIQATGRDARGRKQYRYHERWRQERDSGKFDRLLDFSRTLPRLRRQVQKHLKETSHSRELVLATVVHLLDTTLVRVGNDQYARQNKSYGLTTLRNRHVQLGTGGGLVLSFRGKSGVQHEVKVKDPRVCRVVRRCLHLPGQELFQYRDADGGRHAVSSGDVNDYLRAVCGEGFTAKDFRTWHGSVLALQTLQKFCAVGEPFTLKQLLAEVAGALGNTPAVCRKAYIHPGVLELAVALAGRDAGSGFDGHVPPARAIKGLAAAEQRLVAFVSKA
jgi:DNA topoisomerase-1